MTERKERRKRLFDLLDICQKCKYWKDGASDCDKDCKIKAEREAIVKQMDANPSEPVFEQSDEAVDMFEKLTRETITKDCYEFLKKEKFKDHQIAKKMGVSRHVFARMKKQMMKVKEVLVRMEATKQNYEKLVAEGKTNSEIAKIFGYNHIVKLTHAKKRWAREEKDCKSSSCGGTEFEKSDTESSPKQDGIKLDVLANEYDKIKDENSTLKGEPRELKEKCESLQKHADRMQEDYTKELHDMKKIKSKLADQLDKCLDETEQLRDESTNLKAEIKRLQKQIEGRADGYRQVRDQCRGLEYTKKNLEKQLEKAQTEIDKVKSDWQEQYKKQYDEIKELAAELDKTRKERDLYANSFLEGQAAKERVKLLEKLLHSYIGEAQKIG